MNQRLFKKLRLKNDTKNNIHSCLTEIKKTGEWEKIIYILILILLMKEKKSKAINIAKSLPEYFTKEALSQMEKDFDKHKIIYSGDVDGFLNYKTDNSKLTILWMAVKRELQSGGIGQKLLMALEDIAKVKRIKIIEVETLSPNEKYKPYKRVRKFYEKNGFSFIKIKPPLKEGWDEMGVWVRRL